MMAFPEMVLCAIVALVLFNIGVWLLR